MKKIISTLLATVLLLTMVPMCAGAAEEIFADETMEDGAFDAGVSVAKGAGWDNDVSGVFVEDELQGKVYMVRKNQNSSAGESSMRITVPLGRTVTGSKVHISYKVKASYLADRTTKTWAHIYTYANGTDANNLLTKLYWNYQDTTLHHNWGNKTKLDLPFDEWIQVDVIINQDTAPTELWLNGELIKTSAVGAGKYALSGSSLHTLYFDLLANCGGDTTGIQDFTYFDDMRVEIFDDEGFCVRDTRVTDDAVLLNFLTPVKTSAAELAGAVLKKVGTDGETSVNLTVENSTILKVPVSGLDAGAEYVLCLPDGVTLTDAFDRTFDTNAIHFNTPAADGANPVLKLRTVGLNGEEMIPWGTVDNVVGKINVSLQSNVGTAPTATLTNGTTPITLTPTGSGKEWSYSLASFMNPGDDYTFSLSYGESDTYVWNFHTAEGGDLVLKEIKLYKATPVTEGEPTLTEVTALNELSDGDTLTIKVVIYNTTGDPNKNVCLSYGLYSGGFLKGVNFVSGTLAGNVTGDELSKSFIYDSSLNIDEICGFVIDSMALTKPLSATKISIK